MIYYYQENHGELTDPVEASHLIPSTNRNSRLLSSKQHLQSYLDSVKQDLSPQAFPQHSVLTKLPAHPREAYLTPEMVRNGLTNKTIASFHKQEDSPRRPVLDVQRKVVQQHQTDIMVGGEGFGGCGVALLGEGTE